jgi:hypothetical protein
MNRLGLLRLVVVLCLVSSAALGQQPTPPPPPPLPQPNPQAATYIQQGLSALDGGLQVTDVTMTGTYTVTNASGTQSGTITLVATASGQGQSTVTLPSGTYSETRTISGGSASMTETGPDGVAHAISTQTALSPNPAWFCPALVLTAASSSSYLSSYVAQETLNGEAVQHLAVWWLPGNSSSSSSASATAAPFWQRATQHDMYLDSSSMLPVSMTFLLHPYNPKAPNQPYTPYPGSDLDGVVQVIFSEYQVVQGRHVALQIQGTLKTAAGTVLSNIQISSVTFNTGVTINVPSTAN